MGSETVITCDRCDRRCYAEEGYTSLQIKLYTVRPLTEQNCFSYLCPTCSIEVGIETTPAAHKYAKPSVWLEISKLWPSFKSLWLKGRIQ